MFIILLFRVIGISGSLIWSKTLMELIFKPCGEFRWSPELAKCTLLTSTMGPLGSFRFLRSLRMLKREWGAESNGKLPHLSIPSKIATVVPEFVVEALHLGRTAALVPEFAVKYLPLGRKHWWWYVISSYRPTGWKGNKCHPFNSRRGRL